MLIVKASHMGMCFGVRDALEVARAIEQPSQVTVFGELVHNPQIQRELEQRGFQQLAEEQRSTLGSTPEVMVTAHGISHHQRRLLQKHGKKVIDTTCPLVRRAHKAALRLNRMGYFIVVVGRHGHVEVQGLVEDLERAVVVSSAEEVERYSAGRIGVINQTTTPPAGLEKIHRRIRRLNADKELEFVDTICRPTRERQQAIDELVKRVQALVVVGGKNSNNTRQLGLAAEKAGKPWLHIQGPADLEAGWFEGLKLVGLSAGTSTPDEVIEAVHRRLLEIARGNELSARHAS